MANDHVEVTVGGQSVSAGTKEKVRQILKTTLEQELKKEAEATGQKAPSGPHPYAGHAKQDIVW